MENKKSYFYISVDIPNENKQNDIYISELENDLDLVINSMKAMREIYRFKKINNERIVIFFKPDVRKRNGQLDQFCKRYLNDKLDDLSVEIGGISKSDYSSKVLEFSENPNYRVLETPEKLNDEYTRSDIKHFDSEKNWMLWHKKIYSKLFDQNGKLINPHDRKIYYILDKVGKSGKSQFYKWLYNKYPHLIGRISYGNASQLKSSVLNMGMRKIYIVDLARSKGKGDSESDLLSAVEDIKSGLVINPMYGKGEILEMDPPHIIISANYLPNFNSLSADRWEAYEIIETQEKILGNPNKDLVELTNKKIEKLFKEEEEKLIKKQAKIEIQKIKVRKLVESIQES